ncbi:hypothetical protein HETIRDRAFT_173952 [Heterobasidion irregulare TC 32-1]|uniref:Uncharacterized protein n=1 Tax=Heterobasidion irregulare (strain TC 32-1) TaxID=747525 RepID=W4JV44_HETIT|nr:uncharacterized protein HETIRDRAFT_173952 [Heterobasidion irregulare TC 32-1]ETW77407.1 hypothetical protein HETIRDRAFT_173952 [Heterobasidion irregulare TC 32-1]
MTWLLNARVPSSSSSEPHRLVPKTAERTYNDCSIFRLFEAELVVGWLASLNVHSTTALHPCVIIHSASGARHFNSATDQALERQPTALLACDLDMSQTDHILDFIGLYSDQDNNSWSVAHENRTATLGHPKLFSQPLMYHGYL